MRLQKNNVKWCMLAAFMLVLAPTVSGAMHIMEGFLPVKWAVIWYVLFIPFFVVGLKNITKVYNSGNEKLKALDEDAANRIHKNNTKRVIRALEVCLDGKKMQDFSTELKYNENYQPIIIVLNRDREVLYERINKRVDIMIEDGLVEEVSSLKDKFTTSKALKTAIGYKEFIPYFDNKESIDVVLDNIKKNSRHYAKRQYTFFNHSLSPILS